MNVTLRQLRAFIAVAEAGHFTRAAEQLSLSQSSVSTLVRELEANLGLRLFDRHTRMLRLTQAGTEILPLVKKAIADLNSVIGSSIQLKTLGRGRVSIAASTLQAALLLPRLIREFCLLHPGVKVTLHDVTEHEVLEMVRAGTADFGLGTEAGNQPGLSAQVLSTDVFVAVLPPGHALERKPELGWDDLAGESLIGPGPGNPIREYLDRALAREGIALTRLYEVSLPLTIAGMVEGGLGVAVMTTAAARLAEVLGLTIRRLTNPVIERELSLIVHADRSLSPSAQSFRELLVRRRRELAGH